MQRSFRPGANRRRTSFKPSKRGSSQAGIHHSKFINKAIEIEADIPYEPIHTFADFGLNKQTLETLEHLNFKTPSEVQDLCIKPSIEGRDVIGLANTGTGKTAAFVLPIIEKLLVNRNSSIGSVLILAPTRELAQQIDNEFKRFSAGLKLYSCLVVGGANIARQIQQIKRGPHVIVATPGRAKDLINRKVLRLSGVNTFVLDEADRMCDMGFEKDIRSIELEMPKSRQTLCYSATMTPSVKKIVEEFMIDPITISVVKGQTNEHIEQDIIRVNSSSDKFDVLADLLCDSELEKVIVFGETKYGVQRLADRLEKMGVPAVAIHGNKSQSQREKALRSFKQDEARVLVATDVAARGLDIPNVSHVINFDPPKVYDDYIHRIGRTGRAGKSGKALTFVTSR